MPNQNHSSLSAGPARSALVLYAHPAPHRSRVNRQLAAAAGAMAGVSVHELYAAYPDFYLDVAAEQARLSAADVVVWLHPIQWYSMPSLMKEWVDTVLTAGWAYGAGGAALKGKTLLLAATTGSGPDAYSEDGAHARPFSDYLPAYIQTAALCQMHWAPPHVLHGAHQVANEVVEAHVAQFTARLRALLHAPVTAHAQD